jgi:hypothetical protein
MPTDNPTQRIADISEALKVFFAQSLSHLNKAEISANAFDKLQITIKWLTTSAGGGGMTWWKERGVSENA